MKKHALACLLLCGAATHTWAAELPYSLPFNAANEFSQVGVDWSKAVADATGGEIVFEPVFNSALVAIPETLDAVSGGVVPSAMAVVSAMSGTIPAFGYIEMGGSMPLDNPPAEEAMETIFPDVERLLAAHDVKALWIMPAFGGGLACRTGFVESVDDWAGKKIRAAGRWQAKQVEALGGSPISLPAADIYTALQNGTIDCALIVPTIYLASSLYEAAPYFSGYELVGNALITIVGNNVWDGLTDEQRQAIEDVSQETTLTGTKRLREINEQALAEVSEKANLYRVTPEEREKLARRWDPVFQELVDGVTDEFGRSLVDTLYSMRK